LKPPLFSYYAANSVEDAVQHLVENPGALILAGGQSLVPAMNFRLASPDMLIDIGRIEGLDKISVTADEVAVGANVRHRDVELSDEVLAAQPILRQALQNVAHVPIRHRGTTVGSICHADAAAEMPMMLVLTGGYVTAVGSNGSRKIMAKDFFRFHMTTSRAADEMIVSAHFPLPPCGAGSYFREFARRKGDYALAGVGAIIGLDAGGKVSTVSIAACGIASTPVRLTEVEQVLKGQTPDASTLDRAAEIAVQSVMAPDDTLTTKTYRKHLLSGLVKDVISKAAGLKEEALA
jgi:CO/xanthine dehydrogenase FAD-binding subunit